MKKENDFINHSICKSHYLSSGWIYSESELYDIFSHNAFVYTCHLSDSLTLNPPLRISKKDLLLHMRRLEECNEIAAYENIQASLRLDVILIWLQMLFPHLLKSQIGIQGRLLEGLCFPTQTFILFLCLGQALIFVGLIFLLNFIINMSETGFFYLVMMFTKKFLN